MRRASLPPPTTAAPQAKFIGTARASVQFVPQKPTTPAPAPPKPVKVVLKPQVAQPVRVSAVSAPPPKPVTIVKQQAKPVEPPTQAHGSPVPKKALLGGSRQPNLVNTNVSNVGAENVAPVPVKLKELVDLKKDKVYVFIRNDEKKGASFSFPWEMSPSEIIEAVVEAANMAKDKKYAIGMAEIGLFFRGDDHHLPVKRMTFFQACSKIGIPSVFEFFEIDPRVVFRSSDPDLLAQTIMNDFALLTSIDPMYAGCLSKLNDEVFHARRALARFKLEREAKDTRTKEQKYLQDEQMFCRTKLEAAITPETNGRLFDVDVYAPFSDEPHHCQLDVFDTVLQAAKMLLPTLITEKGAKHEDYAFKIVGLEEYLIPYNAEGKPYTLNSFDYIRRCVLRREPIRLQICPRSNLHQRENDDKFTAAKQVLYSENGKSLTPCDLISTVLSRDIFLDSHEILSNPKLFTPACTVDSDFKMHIGMVSKINWVDEEKGVSRESFSVCVGAGIYYGGKLLSKMCFTPFAPYEKQETALLFSLNFGLATKMIPREARVCMTVYGVDGTNVIGTVASEATDKMTPLGWVSFMIYDYQAVMRTGDFSLRCWEGLANPIGPCHENPSQERYVPVLSILVRPTSKPVVFVDVDKCTPMGAGYKRKPREKPATEEKLSMLAAENMKRYKKALEMDPLADASKEDSEVLWEYRELVRKFKARSLSKLLRAVDWSNPDMVNDMHELLERWDVISPTYALELLDARFPDMLVREYAIRCLSAMDDETMSQFILQMAQVLRYEPYHDSALARFLLFRAARNVRQIGHVFYWVLKADMTVPEVSERNGVLLEAYLRLCGQYIRDDISRQNDMLMELENVARAIKVATTKEARHSTMEKGLFKVPFDGPVTLPLDTKWKVNGIVVEKCKVFDSKKLPVRVVFQNADPLGDPIYVIYKVGDDIRQDILTLQLMRVMDKLWKDRGLDLRMNLYTCVATGDQMGMIECVLNSETTYNICVQMGGATAIMADSTITEWIKGCNTDPEDFKKAQENFKYSCAGYCVATYVLGIGDRHASNVMVTRKGDLFHIDFGHFLGNFKTKLGVKRERTAFKFTGQYAHVFGGKGSAGYQSFLSICGDAFCTLRHNSDLFITLFGLMVSTGIPELRCVEDISYLRNAFLLDKDDNDAKKKFCELADNALGASSQTINDMFHHLKHR